MYLMRSEFYSLGSFAEVGHEFVQNVSIYELRSLKSGLGGRKSPGDSCVGGNSDGGVVQNSVRLL